MIKKEGRVPQLLYGLDSSYNYNFWRVLMALQMNPSSARWLSQAPEAPDPVDVVVFLGCIPLHMPNLLFTELDILEKMGIDYVALAGNGLCCGAGHFNVGRIKEAEASARELISNIMAFKPQRVVFPCVGCYSRVASTLPQFMKVPFHPEHLSQFLLDNVHMLPFVKPIEKTITYHDSCALGRKSKEYEAPRNLLQAIPGIKIVEMDHNREDTICCGGFANFTNPDVSRKLRITRLQEAKTAGAQILVSTCTGCQNAFCGGEKNFSIEVLNDTILLGEAMGIRYEDAFKRYVNHPDLNTVIDEARDYIKSNDLSLDKMRQMVPLYIQGFRW
jgi:heterodisulfide reductase subunit D